jgi:hypothetical protein
MTGIVGMRALLEMDLAEKTFGGYFFNVMLATHFFGWFTQFLGHFKYE